MTNHNIQLHTFKKRTFQNISITNMSYVGYRVLCLSWHAFSLNLSKTKISSLKGLYVTQTMLVNSDTCGRYVNCSHAARTRTSIGHNSDVTKREIE